MLFYTYIVKKIYLYYLYFYVCLFYNVYYII